VTESEKARDLLAKVYINPENDSATVDSTAAGDLAVGEGSKQQLCPISSRPAGSGFSYARVERTSPFERRVRPKLASDRSGSISSVEEFFNLTRQAGWEEAFKAVWKMSCPPVFN
jgi:hypothetical protein